MSPVVLHRISAALLAFFAVAHTAGMLDTSPKSVTVELILVGMRNARFPIMGTERTLYDFYFGFGILVSVLLVLAAFVSLTLARLATRAPDLGVRLGIAHGVCLVGVFAICLVFFFPAPTITSGLAMLSTIVGTLATLRARGTDIG